MHPSFVRPDGIILRREVIAAGYSDQWLKARVRSEELERLRQGVYCDRARFAEMSPAAKHIALAQAVQSLHSQSVALSHTSAAMKWGAPDWGVNLDAVHLTHLDGMGERKQALITHHRGKVRVGDVTRLAGSWITTPARTALDAAAVSSRDAGVCIADDFLHRGLVTPEALQQSFASKRDWPHSLRLMSVLALCAQGAQSVGETRTRLLIHDQGLPAPKLQFPVYSASGEHLGDTDMAWPEYGALLEFDGRFKYSRFLRPGEKPEDAVWREKRREDLIREATGWRMIRLVWSDLDRPKVTGERIARLLRPAA